MSRKKNAISKRMRRGRKNQIPTRIKRVTNTALTTANQFRSLGSSARKLITVNETINSVAASPNLQFSTVGQIYYNLSQIASQVDFISLASDFEMVRIKSISIQVRRILPEGSMASVYSTFLKPIYLAYYPTRVSYNPGSLAVTNRESAMIIDPMLIETQVASYKIPNVSALVTTGGNYFTYNMSSFIPTSATGAIPGCIVLGMDNATNASISTGLFSFRLIFDCEFASPF